MNTLRSFACCSCVALAALHASAGASEAGWIPVAADVLDQARGGFTMPGGLELSLGIERMVLINGEIVARTNVQIADIRAVSPAEALAARDALATTTLVQNGSGAVFSGDGSGGTFIQNSLSDQVIRSQTVISSTVNSTSLLKDINFNQSVRDAALQTVGAF